MAAVDQKYVFLSLKILTSLTGNTWEDLKYVRWQHNDIEGASHPFKVMIPFRAKMFVGIYSGN